MRSIHTRRVHARSASTQSVDTQRIPTRSDPAQSAPVRSAGTRGTEPCSRGCVPAPPGKTAGNSGISLGKTHFRQRVRESVDALRRLGRIRVCVNFLVLLPAHRPISEKARARPCARGSKVRPSQLPSWQQASSQLPSSQQASSQRPSSLQASSQQLSSLQASSQQLSSLQASSQQLSSLQASSPVSSLPSSVSPLLKFVKTRVRFTPL